MIEQYLTTEQVASILQIHPFTVLKFLKSGKLSGVKIGRVYRIKESDVHEFLEQSQIASSKGSKKQQSETPASTTNKSQSNSEEESHYYII